jgi:hypothetical protein
MFAWRHRLRMASFKNQPFYVEQQGRSSGRRVVLFQYPKRDLPYAEDMGREALRYQITGYLIQAPLNPIGSETSYHGMPRDYDVARDLLEAALMSANPGVLIDPYNPWLSGMSGYGLAGPMFMCERYTIIESREKGGFCQVEMSFVEAGIPANIGAMLNTGVNVVNTSNNASAAAGTQLNTQQMQFIT